MSSAPLARRCLPALQLLPSVSLVAVIIVIPVLILIVQSFTGQGYKLETYRQLIFDGYTLTVTIRTLGTSAFVTLISLIIAYPYAYAITVASETTAKILLAIALLSFWTSVVARTFAWIVLLQQDGPLDRLFVFLGFGSVELLHSLSGAMIGMVHIMLPYMILTLYTNFRSIDRNLLAAAQTLGANPWAVFRSVYLPLSMPGVIAGATLVSIVSLGFYITPAMLGTPRQALVAQLLDIQITQLLDFPAAGATSVILFALILALFGVFRLAAFIRLAWTQIRRAA